MNTKEKPGPSAMTEPGLHEFRQAIQEEAGFNVCAFEYPTEPLSDRLLDMFEVHGMTRALARHIAENEPAARALLGDEVPTDSKPPAVSLHDMLDQVLDSVAAVAEASGATPTPQQLAQACFAFGAAWHRPWIHGLSPTQLAARCGVSPEAMSRRMKRVRELYGLPQAKSPELRAKMSEGRRRWLERPRPVIVTSLRCANKDAA